MSRRCFASRETLPNLRRWLLNGRREVFDLLHGENGRLHNDDQMGGFRDLRGGNRSLKLGPDFGEPDCGEEVYRPAYLRYSGRFFSELEKLNIDLSRDFWNELPRDRVEVLFVSGLYGLLYWDDAIQEYDCHLSDSIEGQEQMRTVAELWKPLLTDVLCEFINTEKRHGRPIGHVFDLLSEELYQGLFDWERVCSKARVQVHHRVFRRITGSDALPFIAQVLATQLTAFYEESNLFRHGKWRTPSPNSQNSLVKFSFEYPLGSDDSAAREGGIDKAHKSILADNPILSKLPFEVLKRLVVAEHSWQRAQSQRHFDFGALCVSYAKAVEQWLHSELGDWGSKPVSAAVNQSHLRRLTEDVGELWRLRNSGAHTEPKCEVTKSHVRDARRLALRILSRGLEINS